MLPEKPVTRREMYLDYIARNGAIGGGITIDEEPTQGSYHATGSGGLYDALESLREDIAALRVEVDSKIYGVAGVGQEASALTRTHDAVGMVAQVGTDGDNSGVRNDFDNAGPWMRRKCVGRWVDGGDRARFVVSAYLGDPWYTEDGSIGDYVAVECPRCYYRFNHETGALDITAQQREGFRAFDIFCHNHNQAETMPVFYAPAYFLGKKNGYAVSLPGLDDEQGAYKVLVDAAKTYNGDAMDFAMINPAAWFFYEWALFTVEFATQNCQSVMMGCCNLRSANSEECVFIDSDHAVAPYHVARVAGQYVAIGTQTGHTYAGYQATHKVLSVARGDADGTANASGSYSIMELDDLGKGYVEYVIGTTYYIAARPYRTGECNGVSTPSGSVVSNENGYYPCKYRWVENPWGNHYQTAADLFNVKEGSSDDDWYLEWYYLLKPWEYVPASTSQPDKTALQGDGFTKLGISTPHADYADGYIKSKKYDARHPDIWIPGATKGASSTTYFSDNAYLVSSHLVRSCRFCGYWYNGAIAGLSFIIANSAPSNPYASWSAALFFAQ